MLELRSWFFTCVLFGLACSFAEGGTAQIRLEGTRWVLANASVERVVETQPFLHTTEINNLTADTRRRHVIESRGFALALDDGKLLLSAADFQVQPPQAGDYPGGVQLTVPLRCAKHGVGVTVTYRLGHDAFYLRKQLEIEPGDHLVNWIDVESLRLDVENLQRFDRVRSPFLIHPWDIDVGRPLFAGGQLFLGVEHPASVNSFDDQRWISLRQYPGRRGQISTSPAVIGVCPDRPRQRLLDWFERYIDQNRARPVGRTVQWITYFNWLVDDDACRAKIAVAEKVFRRRDVPLDVVLMDSGWTDPQSIMKIDPKHPDRLDLINKLVRQRLGAKLGLHVVTSGLPRRVDKDYLAAQGYDMIFHKSRQEGAYCLADPRVLTEFQDNLLDYLRQYDIAAYKFDWGHFTCGQSGHRGHLPGKEYGFEAGATNFIRAQQAFRKANPEVFLFNTGWYSPWWLWTYDAVFAAGADYNFNLLGPPSFDTSSLLCTWRDATIRGNIVRWSPFFPVNSLMTCDPISYWWQDWNVHSESRLRPFTDYFVAACLRGTQMIEIYNNISAWSESHADAAAGVLKWMKAHDDIILASTRYFGGDPLVGDPYGYAHFTRENRGIFVVRNPTVGPQTIEIPFDETTGMWPGDKSYIVRIVYPYTMVLPEVLHYGSKLSRPLCGHEAVVLEVWPLDALPEPMPVGHRYQVVARESGKTTFRLEAARDAGELEILSPVKISGGIPVGGRDRLFTVSLRGPGRHSASPPATQENNPGSVAPLRTEGSHYLVPVHVGAVARARVILQFDEPAIRGEAMLDGRPVAAEAPHLRLPDSKDRTEGLRARALNWSLFGIDVGPGSHEIEFSPVERPKRCPTVLIDTRQDVSATRFVEVAHEPVATTRLPLLPQNWAWETRHMESLPKPGK